MASNTERFGLLKKDPIADGADTFNIQTMLNDNWDKLDGAAKKTEVDAKYTKPASGIPKADLSTTVQASLNKADSAVQSVPDATTVVKGIVQLNDNTNSTSTAQAATANAVKKVNDALVTHSTETSQQFASVNRNIVDLAIELETMKAAELTGVDANIFIETFQNLDDVTIERGGYDSANKRLEV